MSEQNPLRQHLVRFREDFAELHRRIATTLIGMQGTLDAVLTALVCGGHVLLEGTPGVGKTLLARSLAKVVDVDYRRIQFTSDMMPADITGTYIVMESQGRRRFEFQEGPLFTNLLLADEINRATPKTQAALLEAMDERSVTVANEVYDLPTPFVVIATQSPDESSGTFPLPENQMDRFFCRLKVPQPSVEDLEAILEQAENPDAPQIECVLTASRLAEMQVLARQVSLANDIRNYAARLVAATGPSGEDAAPLVNKFVERGAGPRGALALVMAAKVRGILDDRTYVAREDLVAVAPWTLGHRLALNYDGLAAGIDPGDVVQEILESMSRLETT